MSIKIGLLEKILGQSYRRFLSKKWGRVKKKMPGSGLYFFSIVFITSKKSSLSTANYHEQIKKNALYLKNTSLFQFLIPITYKVTKKLYAIFVFPNYSSEIYTFKTNS